MIAMPASAMILAAGLGTRMRPLTDDRPKPLIDVAGKPLIDWTLDRFEAAGVKNAVVNVHYFADMMEAHVANRRAPKVSISDERALLLETGGGLAKARPLLGDGPVFCTNTDAILIDGAGPEPCARLAAAWDPAQMDALLLLAPKAAASGYDGAGDFDLRADGRLAWRGGESADYIYTGLQIISLSLLDGAPEGPFSARLLWDNAAAKGRFRGVVHDGAWMHVGDPAGLAEAERRLAAMRRAAQ
ncbi:MAG: nucleotidyltransferase family protein [Pseudomonadota bacterium]|nr:nucleotidyltransferase family protein [Pseudomonadota bacterium]